MIPGSEFVDAPDGTKWAGLAADPGCPKRGLLLWIIDRIATMPRPDIVDTMTEPLSADALAAAAGPGEVIGAEWVGPRR